MTLQHHRLRVRVILDRRARFPAAHGTHLVPRDQVGFATGAPPQAPFVDDETMRAGEEADHDQHAAQRERTEEERRGGRRKVFRRRRRGPGFRENGGCPEDKAHDQPADERPSPGSVLDRGCVGIG
ncbi:hypothetical protein [Amycolatopsis nalaikhensis]|uniref:Uncharacterized protein n=1 Tax=Amycolatopsis nalaikhensis TaxID=715472 RepID=A0ABY8XXK1_9PSEU|nr:hypothetical protein [Amycolatopsis sp. 2-2]WIV60317.1 hypothetical protein QP939_17755 [Amycolatopsis sp. 2-2]